MFPKALLLASLYAGMALVVVLVYRRLLGSKASGDSSRHEHDGQLSSDGDGDFHHHTGNDDGFAGHGGGDGGDSGGDGGDGGGD